MRIRRMVARALDVTGILAGRVSQRGDNLSISVELIDGRDRTQVWGEQYVRKAAGPVSGVGGHLARRGREAAGATCSFAARSREISSGTRIRSVVLRTYWSPHRCVLSVPLISSTLIVRLSPRSTTLPARIATTSSARATSRRSGFWPL